MMKNIIYICLFTLSFIFNSKIVLADIPITSVVLCEIETKDGIKHKGYMEDIRYGGSRWNADKNICEVYDEASGRFVECTDSYFLHKYFQWEFAAEKTLLYREFHKLSYMRFQKETAIEDGVFRLAFAAFDKNEKEEIDTKEIIKASALHCYSTDSPAPVLELPKEEIIMLSRPARAVFTGEYTSHANTVSFISYNEQWDTQDKLKELVGSFLLKNRKELKIVSPDKVYSSGELKDNWITELGGGGADAFEGPGYEWYDSLDKFEDLFKKEYASQGIVLLIYNVTD